MNLKKKPKKKKKNKNKSLNPKTLPSCQQIIPILVEWGMGNWNHQRELSCPS